MAQYRQSGNFINGGVVGNGAVASGAVSIGIHSSGVSSSSLSQKHQVQQQSRHHHHHHHPRRFKAWHRKISITALTVFICIALVSSVITFLFLTSQNKEINTSYHSQDDEIRNDADFLSNVTRTSKSKVLNFGHESITHGIDSDLHNLDRDDRRKVKEYTEEDLQKAREDSLQVSDKHHKISGLYNEAGRDELKHYEAEYEASLDKIDQPKYESLGTESTDQLNDKTENKLDDIDDEYDDVIDLQDVQRDEHTDKIDTKPKTSKIPTLNRKMGSKKKPKRHKFSPCEMKLLNSSSLIVEPLESRKFARFSLQYTETEEKPMDDSQWEPRFAGHQTLEEREESFIARDQKINCGFINGPEESQNTGFELAEDDSKYISSCHIAVSSCIFGNSDRLRMPAGKTISKLSKKNVCFVMFVDEETKITLTSEGHMPDRMGFIGLWKLVVVKNLPYTDMRRVGKIPKLLSHRLFPSARYSIWLDSKLRMQLDPLLILEYLLWRKGFEYAISNHYDRHCVWEEVAQNKKLNKYNHTLIDQQFLFYQSDGLKRFDPSDPNKFLPSNVPEGSLIVRAHTPMSNLFSCLWFNEVDRFTSRDQLSFAYTYNKLRRMNLKKPFRLNMFKDCERRKIAKLFHHRSEEKKGMVQQESE